MVFTTHGGGGGKNKMNMYPLPCLLFFLPSRVVPFSNIIKALGFLELSPISPCFEDEYGNEGRRAARLKAGRGKKSSEW